MNTHSRQSAIILGVFFLISVLGSAQILSNSAIRFKEYERTVSVKGLSEREVAADTAVWPVRFSIADNDVSNLYATLEKNSQSIRNFLIAAGFSAEEITVGTPIVTDRYAQRWGEQQGNFRYTAEQSLTLYTQKIDLLRATQLRTAELGKQGIVIGGEDYGQGTQYLFTQLNEIKPAMVEEATRNARLVAEQFAKDSNSQIGKLRRASQGQFTVEDRDSTTPHLKKIRVVSTVDYYLAD